MTSEAVSKIFIVVEITRKIQCESYQAVSLATNSSMHLSELPPSSTLPITFPMQSSRTSFLTIPLSSARALNPIPQTSSTNLALVGWSVHRGATTIGTPRLSASRVEFQPPLVRKHPMTLCAKTFSWGHHDTTRPFSTVSSLKFWGSLACWDSSTTIKK